MAKEAWNVCPCALYQRGFKKNTSILLVSSMVWQASSAYKVYYFILDLSQRIAQSWADVHEALCARHGAKGFTFIISFNRYDNL